MGTHAKHPFVQSLHSNGHTHTGQAFQLKVSGKQNGAALRLLASAVWLAIVLPSPCAQTRCVIAVKHVDFWKVQSGNLSLKKVFASICLWNTWWLFIHKVCNLERQRNGVVECCVELLVIVHHFCHVRNLKVLWAGKFWAAQKDLLYLERGPERYVLAWSVSRAFSTIDGVETHSTRMLRWATPGLVSVYTYSCVQQRLQTLTTASICMKSDVLASYNSAQVVFYRQQAIAPHARAGTPRKYPTATIPHVYTSNNKWCLLTCGSYYIYSSEWYYLPGSEPSLLQLLVTDWSADKLWQVFNVDTGGRKVHTM